MRDKGENQPKAEKAKQKCNGECDVRHRWRSHGKSDINDVRRCAQTVKQEPSKIMCSNRNAGARRGR